MSMHLPDTESESPFDGLDAIDTISQLMLASHFDPDALLQAITDVTVRKMGMKGCVLRLLNPETGELGIRSVTGLSERFLFSAPVIDARNRFQTMIEEQGVYRLLDVRASQELQFSEAALAEGIASLLAVGLFKDNKVIGSLSVYTAHPLSFTPHHERTLRVLARYAVMAIELARLYRQELQTKLQSRDLTIAAGIQHRMLPAVIPSLEGFDLAVRMNPWYEVGGDFYDIARMDEEMLSLAMGDVAGKGMPAALLMSGALMALRSQMGNSRRLPEIVAAVNELLTRDTRSEEYASLICCRLDLEEYVLCYVNAGHPPPLLLRNGRFSILNVGGMPLGIRSRMTFDEGVVPLESGDLIVFRTDGCITATNARGQLYGERRFRNAIRANAGEGSSKIADAILAALRRFVGVAGMRDDQTLIVLRIE
jgi:phosphoserine phosphatase RsbU/P